MNHAEQSNMNDTSLAPTVVAVCVGLPMTRGDASATSPSQRQWTSGFIKRPVEGPVWLGRLNLVGDGQADLRVHGGPDKAALAYSASHYSYWRSELGIAEMGAGGFGENFTIEGLEETSVCLGDTFLIGEAKVQVSQPRQPCWKLARRWQWPELPKLAIARGAMGWYFRVLQEGWVEAGQPLRLAERPLPAWPIAAVNRLFYFNKMDSLCQRQAQEELAACQLLAQDWRDLFAERLPRG